MRWLGVTHYRDEEQHFALFEAGPPLPETFTHTVTGGDADRGFAYRYHWRDVTPALRGVLVQGCGRFLDALLAACE